MAFTLDELGAPTPEELEALAAVEDDTTPVVPSGPFTLDELGQEGDAAVAQEQAADEATEEILMSPSMARRRGVTLTPQQISNYNRAVGIETTPPPTTEDGGAVDGTLDTPQATPEAQEEAVAETDSTSFIDAIGDAADYMSDDAAAFFKRANHKLNIAGENIAMSSAEFVDFIIKADQWRKDPTTGLMGLIDWSDVSIDGERVNSPTFAEVTKHVLLTSKKALGGKPELEGVDGPSDRFTQLAAQNVGPSALLGYGLKAGRQVIKVSDNVVDFLRAEAKLSGFGAGVGTIGEIIGDNEEEKESLSQVFNAMGLMAQPIWGMWTTISPMFNIFKNVIKGEPLYDPVKAHKLSEREVFKHLNEMLPESQIPAVMEKIRIIKEVQKVEPDFRPTVGNIIGTPEAITTQRIIDSKFYGGPDGAAEQYNRTVQAVARITERLKKSATADDKILLTSALRLYADDTQRFLDSTAAHLAQQEDTLRNLNRGTFKSTANAQEIADAAFKTKQIFRETRDIASSLVDPENLAKFDPRTFKDLVDDIVNTTDPIKEIVKRDPEFAYINEVLPGIFAKMSQRSAVPVGPAGINQALGVTPKEKPFLSFKDLNKIYREIGRKSEALRVSSKGTSEIPRILEGLRAEILKVIDVGMTSGSPGVATRYAKFRQFMNKEFYPRFKDGATGKIVPRQLGGRPEIALDEVGDRFWKAGDKTSNLEDYNALYKDLGSVAEGPGGIKLTQPEAVKVAKELSDLALQEHAVNSLQKALDASPEGNPLKILERWKNTFKGSLDEFKFIQPRIDDMERELTTLHSVKLSHADQKVKLEKSIISRYSNLDPDTLGADLLSASPSQAAQILQDLLRTSAGKIDNPEYFDKYPAILEPTKEAGERLLFSSRQLMLTEVLGRSFDASLDGTSHVKLNGVLHDSLDTLETVLTPADMQGLRDYREVLKLVGTSTQPQANVNLDKVQELLNSVGISPASVLSRYYSATLGKVGPLYLIADAGTRLLTAASGKHFDKVFRETMFDIKGLEAVLAARGDEGALRQIMTFRQVISKATQATAGSIFNKYQLTNGFRVITSIDHQNQERLQEQSIMEWFLLNAEDETGQPSRVQSSIEDEEDTAVTDVSNIDSKKFFDDMDAADSEEVRSAIFVDEVESAKEESEADPTPIIEETPVKETPSGDTLTEEDRAAKPEVFTPEQAATPEQTKRIDELSARSADLTKDEAIELASLLITTKGKIQALADVGFTDKRRGG